MHDYYRILGIPSEASPDEVKRAYHALVQRYHPDHNPGDSAAETRFREISDAYATLSDPELRRRYDASRAVATVTSRPAATPRNTSGRHVSAGLNVRVGGVPLAATDISLSVAGSDKLRSAARRALKELIEALDQK